MKFLLSVAAVIAVAVAVPVQRGLVVPGPAGPAPAPENPFVPIAIGPAIIDSFEPVAIGPAIVNPVEGIAVGPAIVHPSEGISVGPAIIPFPLPDGAHAEEPVIAPSPVSVVEGPAPSPAAGSPLVQVIVNVNQAAAESNPISVGPAIVPEPVEIKPEPVHVVEAAPEPVQVVEVAPEPVQVVEVAPVQVEPVQIGVPIIPEAAVVLPEELN